MGVTAFDETSAEVLYKQAGIEVIPLSEAIGAEVRGFDPAAGVDDTTFAAIYRAWLEHLVLRFRGGVMEAATQIAFSRRFGQLDDAPVLEGSRKYVSGHPELFIISNVVEDGHPIGELGAEELFWHSDMDYREHPPKASMLHAAALPAAGGNTIFRNMYQALEIMPAALRARIEGVTMKHDPLFTGAGEPRQGVEIDGVFDVSTSPGISHPVIRNHPDTGRQALYLGRRQNAYINGLSVAESEALLDELWDHALANTDVWTQEWRLCDTLIWDNRCCIHNRDAFDNNARRIMHRTQIRSEERPY